MFLVIATLSCFYSYSSIMFLGNLVVYWIVLLFSGYFSNYVCFDLSFVKSASKIVTFRTNLKMTYTDRNM